MISEHSLVVLDRDPPHDKLHRGDVGTVVHVYKGGFVGLNASGYARPLTAGDRLLGLAYEEADNSSGSNGDDTVRVFTVGDFDHALTGAAVTDIGRPVFASDDATLTFTADGNTYAYSNTCNRPTNNGNADFDACPRGNPSSDAHANSNSNRDTHADGNPNRYAYTHAYR